MNKPVIIIGNGGHASVLTEILLAQDTEILGFTAPRCEQNDFNLPYLGTDNIIENYQSSEVALVLGIGMIQPSPVRQKIFDHFQTLYFQFPTIIHPTAIIAPSVQLEQGVQVMAGAIVQTKTVIDVNTIVNTGARIDHNCRIDAHAHIAPGTTVSGDVHIQQGTHIGTGAVVIQGITIGANCLVGAGAVVTNNIATGMKVKGVPAR